MQGCSKGDSHLTAACHHSTQFLSFPTGRFLISTTCCIPVISTAHSAVSLPDVNIMLPDGTTHLSSAQRCTWQASSLISPGQEVAQSPVLHEGKAAGANLLLFKIIQ